MIRVYAGVCLLSLLAMQSFLFAQQTDVQYLSGKGMDDAVPWDFFCTGGMNSGKWTKIPVPSNWELQGFGAYNYGHDKNKSDEQGKYKRLFDVPESWRGKRIRLVFEGVMTDMEAWINGKPAGPMHQGGFYRFKYDITSLIKLGGSNLIEVTVSKKSANARVEDAERIADYWVFGGIYRPVYLEALPGEFIDWTAIDARADGSFSMRAYVERPAAMGADRLRAQILSLDGAKIGEPFTIALPANQNNATLKTKIASPKLWTAETPNLYRVELALCKGDSVIHSVSERFGFRTIEVRRGDGIYLNGSKIHLKGVDRHSFWPESGRCLSRKLCLDDARLIKEMNMNAVRCSHYPPDKAFLDACDEEGIYVLDELAGWQREPYDTPVGKKLVREMVVRDVNHPSILFWDNGNEGGWNTELDGDFAIYDPQARNVLHPWMFFGDINTGHYPTYSKLTKSLEGPEIVMPTEFLHGLYDGGMGAGLDEYWKAMRASKYGAGGFLWVFADEGVKRTDMNGILDCRGNLAPDGIVGAHHEREGSFYSVKEIWSPIQTNMNALSLGFDGAIEIENQYDFTNLSQCAFEWEVADYSGPSDAASGHKVAAKGKIAGPAAAPNAKATIKIPLPQDWKEHDCLRLTALSPSGALLWTWTWPIHPVGAERDSPAAAIKKSAAATEASGAIRVAEEGDFLTAQAGALAAKFDRRNGALVSVQKNGQAIPFGGGPRLVSVPEEASAQGSAGAGVVSASEARIVSVKASGHEGGNKPENVMDGDLGTRWSADGVGQWITCDLGAAIEIGQASISWQKGASRASKFQIECSQDGKQWTPVFDGKSSGKTADLEPYSFKPVTARYVRITVNGNSESKWASIQEIKIGKAGAAAAAKNAADTAGKPAEGAGAAPKAAALMKHRIEGGALVLEGEGCGGFDSLRWKMAPSGLLELNYRYHLKGEFDSFGISFDLPEEHIKGVKWLGQGPYRVWKNRTKGTTLDVWDRAYQKDGIPGTWWGYPEFKGCFADVRWAVLRTAAGPVTIATNTPGLFMRLYTPPDGEKPGPTGLAKAFPKGDISFLNAIPPIGSKFHQAADSGPQGRRTKAEGAYEGALSFWIGEK
ncbi:MAG: discoidin domain-containing protein [Candidatus Sumerlaeota bacterium]|nr:discoidin domain-containing protein [Candidatus Sumerlaeota bacterium]